MIVSPIAPDLNVSRILLKLCRQSERMAEVKGCIGYIRDPFRDKVWSVTDVAVSMNLKNMICGWAGKSPDRLK